MAKNDKVPEVLRELDPPWGFDSFGSANTTDERYPLREFSSSVQYPDGRRLLADTSSGDWILLSAGGKAVLAEGDQNDKKLPKGVTRRDIKDAFGD